MISRNYFTFPLYVPRVCGLLRNWPLYLFNYLGRQRKPAEYQMRNGFRLVDATGTLAGTIAVVFIRREYGKLRNLRTIVDIGANMGSFSVYAAHSCPEADIYSYEPVPGNFAALTRNITINSLEGRIHAFQCAVASGSGQRDIALGASPLNSLVIPLGNGEKLTVKCTTLNDIFQNQNLKTVDLLKMNCEGAEYEIFGNCPQADLDRIANIRVEYHNLDGEKQNGEALAKLLEGRGFEIQRFTRYGTESGFIWAGRAKNGPGKL